MSKGPLMTIQEAAKRGGISVPAIYGYEKSGYLQFVEIDGFRVVYYRDVLRASWAAKEGYRNRTRKSKKSKKET